MHIMGGSTAIHTFHMQVSLSSNGPDMKKLKKLVNLKNC